MRSSFLTGSVIITLATSGFTESRAQDSLSVPTPSFSNPTGEATMTTVPATGIALDQPRVNSRLFGETTAPSENIPDEPMEPLDPIPPVTTVPEPQANPSAESPASLEPLEMPETKHRPLAPFSKSEVTRAEMLEKLGDQLSMRMRALKEREEAILRREEALVEREKKATEREKLIRQLEESILQREKVVRRREKLPPPQAWQGATPPSLDARYAAVLDGETMQFYHTKNAVDPTPVASTQKLMTALVICSAGGLDETVVIPRAATLVEPTKVGIKTDERYTRRQLLTALLVRSGNDLAAALAIDNAGSVEAFAAKMNLMGRKIGLVNSDFKNPHGLPSPGQYSCARDIAIVAFEAYQVPEIRDIVNRKSYRFEFNDGNSLLLSNTNRLLQEMDSCNGMKTGFTFAAGRCLVSSAREGDQHRISVVIKTTNSGVWADSRKLLDWSFNLEMLGPLTSVGDSGDRPEI